MYTCMYTVQCICVHYKLYMYNDATLGFNDSGVDSLMFESPHVDGVSSWSVTEDISKLELYPTTPEKDLYVFM